MMKSKSQDYRIHLEKKQSKQISGAHKPVNERGIGIGTIINKVREETLQTHYYNIKLQSTNEYETDDLRILFLQLRLKSKLIRH